MWLLCLTAVSVLSGTVRERGTLEPVPFATIEQLSTGRTTAANAKGVFFMPDFGNAPGRVRVVALGYETAEIDVDPGSGPVELLLTPRPVSVEELVVRAPRGGLASGISTWRMRADEARLVPQVGEPDVLRAIQDVPAVTSFSDYSAGVYVRGGTPDQTGILLDGAPLFNPYHLGGFFAAVDPGALSVSELHASVPPVDASDRLSGVLNLTTRDGGRDHWRSSGGVGLVSARLSVDGPLSRTTTGMLSVRRTYVGTLVAAARTMGLTDRRFPYGFTDAHLKLTQLYGRTGSISVAAYRNAEDLGSVDGFGISEPLDGRWTSRTLSVQQRQSLSQSLALESLAAVSQFDARAQYGDLSRADGDAVDGAVRMRTLRVGAAVSWHRGRGRTTAGVQYENHSAEHRIRSSGTLPPRLFPDLDLDASISTMALYADQHADVGDAWRFNVGLRSVIAPDRGARLLPRARVTFDIAPWAELSAAAGRSTQTWQSLRNEEAVAARLFAYDVLMPVSADFPVVDEVAIGLGVVGETLDLRAEAFARRYQRLRVPALPADPEEAAILNDELVHAHGEIIGAELSLGGAVLGGRMEATYVWNRHERTMGDVTFTPAFSREHRVRAAYLRSLGAGVLSARALWGSGLPYTGAVGAVTVFRRLPDGSLGAPRQIAVLGPHNSERLPPYVRLDVSYRGERTLRLLGRPMVLAPYVQVFNVFNSRNVFRAEPTVSGGEPRVEYAPRLPFLPTFGVEWRF